MQRKGDVSKILLRGWKGMQRNDTERVGERWKKENNKTKNGAGCSSSSCKHHIPAAYGRPCWGAKALWKKDLEGMRATNAQMETQNGSYAKNE